MPAEGNTPILRSNTPSCGTTFLSIVVFLASSAFVKKTLLLLESCEAMEAAGWLATSGTAAAVVALLNYLSTDSGAGAC